MSRLAGGYAGIPVRVSTDATTGAPRRIEYEREHTPVVEIVGFFREWIGVLDGEPQRDVWRVKDASGRLCELHHLFSFIDEENEDEAHLPLSPLSPPDAPTWLLVRWDD